MRSRSCSDPVRRVAELLSLSPRTFAIFVRLMHKAVGLGILTEGLLVTVAASGGFGPCGAASIRGSIVLTLHLPGMLVVAPLHSLHLPDWLLWCFVFALYAGFWSCVWGFFLRRRTRRARRPD